MITTANFKRFRVRSARVLLLLEPHQSVARAWVVLVVGAVCGSLLLTFGAGLYIYEDYYRKRFYKRIYID